MEKLTKRELKENYKNRSVIGGVYCIQCNGNGHTWMKSTKNMVGQKNRYQFFFSTNTCPESSMLTDWNTFGAKSFSFIVLEEMEKKETLTDREFADEIDLLYEIWKDKKR